MTWKNAIIAIFSPTTSGDNKGVYGTAFPVGADLVMTARHVVLPQNADQTRPIKLRWWYGGGWVDYQNRCALILWSCKTLDVALLKVPNRPASVVGQCRLSSRKPASHTKWASEGFPIAARIEDLPRPSSVHGEVMEKADHENHFQITVDAGLRSTIKDGWGGASGMPIVVDGHVVGIAVRVEANFPDVIQAAPVWKFWDKVRDHIVPSESTTKFEKEAIRRLTEFFRNREALDVIFDDRKECKELFCDQTGMPSPEMTVRKILDMKPRDLFLHLYYASNALEKKISEVSAAGDDCERTYRYGRKLLDSIIDHVAPYVFAVSTGRAMLAEGAQIREIPVATLTMAELVMAAQAARDVALWPRRTDADLPRGKAHLPLTVEFSENGVMARMITDGFLKEYVGEAPPHVDNVQFGAAAKSLVARVVEKDPGRIRSINNALAGKVERNEALPYLAIVSPVEETQRSALRAELEIAHREIPLLPIIVLESDQNILDEEEYDLDHYIRLIPMTKA